MLDNVTDSGVSYSYLTPRSTSRSATFSSSLDLVLVVHVFDDSLNNFSYSTRHLILEVILVNLLGDTNRRLNVKGTFVDTSDLILCNSKLKIEVVGTGITVATGSLALKPSMPNRAATSSAAISPVSTPAPERETPVVRNQFKTCSIVTPSLGCTASDR